MCIKKFKQRLYYSLCSVSAILRIFFCRIGQYLPVQRLRLQSCIATHTSRNPAVGQGDKDAHRQRVAPPGNAAWIGQQAAQIALLASTPAQGGTGPVPSARHHHPQRTRLPQATQSTSIARGAFGWLGRRSAVHLDHAPVGWLTGSTHGTTAAYSVWICCRTTVHTTAIKNMGTLLARRNFSMQGKNCLTHALFGATQRGGATPKKWWLPKRTRLTLVWQGGVKCNCCAAQGTLRNALH